MVTKVHMEALSPTMEEGQLVRWLKSEGDEVSNGDILAEIETDKATMELVARGDGVLRKIFLADGGTAAVGAVIGVIAAADEDISGVEGEAGGGTPAGGGEPEAAAGPDDGEDADAESGAGAAATTEARPDEGARREPKGDQARGGQPGGRGSGAATSEPATSGRVKASPIARRPADEAGVDLSRVQGSGPGGRIVKRDRSEARRGGAAA